jgi:predicted ATP-dependent protease
LSVIEDELNAVRSMARLEGFDIRQTAQGATLTPANEPGAPATGNVVPDPQSPGFIHALPNLANRLGVIVRQSIALWVAVGQRMDQSERTLAEGVTAPLLDEIVNEFGKFDGLVDWIAMLREDIADNIPAFLGRADSGSVPAMAFERRPEQRYAVNLLIDNRDQLGGPIVLEPNPTYENMFGWIEYRLGEQPYNTDFTMIRAGALHRANGGVLVLRAEAVDHNVWKHLKAALRDGEIRIEEPHRAGTVPLAGTPKPHPIPLTVKVVLVAPRFWYNAASSSDADFKSYFKIKADIDPDMDATPDNLGVYSGLIRAMATRTASHGIDDDAICYLLGLASKWAGDRSKLSSQFERIEDVIMEASCLREGAGHLTLDLVTRAVGNCRQRNCRMEDRLQEAIARGKVLISTQGAVVGQVNALAVHESVDHIFGLPVRITARTGVGRRGILNIEHDASLGGPIHQKSILVLQGFLWGRFGSRFPPSFNCSITFEQSYETIEGDSASHSFRAFGSALTTRPSRHGINQPARGDPGR